MIHREELDSFTSEIMKRDEVINQLRIGSADGPRHAVTLHEDPLHVPTVLNPLLNDLFWFFFVSFVEGRGEQGA